MTHILKLVINYTYVVEDSGSGLDSAEKSTWKLSVSVSS